MLTLRSPVTGLLRLRGEDDWGSGAYGAGRGDRLHRGLDIVAQPGDPILSPMDGELVREAAPYEDDTRYSGVLLRGHGAWEGVEIKLFYLDGPHEGRVRAGDPIGIAQDLGQKYPGITNHVHVEVRRQGDLLDPTPLFVS
jgi:murein DD-endopeptidase MepM/ murein hydrolase activator NlpD